MVAAVHVAAVLAGVDALGTARATSAHDNGRALSTLVRPQLSRSTVNVFQRLR